MDDQKISTAPRDPKTYEVIGAAMDVHRELGFGFLENVYQEALAKELSIRGVPFEREKRLGVFYKGELLPCTYIADFICFDSIVVELKAQVAITGVDQWQLINYLNATQFDTGLLFNFGDKSLQYRRVYRPKRTTC